MSYFVVLSSTAKNGLIDIYKFVILPIRQIKRMLPHTRRCVNGRVAILHRRIVNDSLLAIPDSRSRLLLVQEHQIRKLYKDQGSERDVDAKHGAETREVSRRVRGVEEKGTDNVACGGASVVEGHDDRLFRCAGRVADDPGDDEGDATEEESQQVITHEKSGCVSSWDGVEHSEAGNDRDDECRENGTLETGFLCGVGGEQNDDKLNGAEWHVEERGDVLVMAKTREDEGPEGVGY